MRSIAWIIHSVSWLPQYNYILHKISLFDPNPLCYRYPGSPQNATIIATTKLAGGHSDAYMLFNEETLYPMVNILGTTSDKIRSDVVFFRTASGGAVFSVGSINWVGAMAWRRFENNVARMTGNVLREFVGRSG